MNKRWMMSALVGVALAATLTGCGSSDDASDAASSAATTVATTAARASEAAATAAASAGSAAATAVQSARATSTPAGPQTVEIKLGDYFFEPKDVTVRPGALRVTLPNDGPERPHTYAVKQKDGNGDIIRSERVAVGQSQTLEFTVSEEGTYQVYCTLPGHADRGQTGTLVVRA